ncbi:MAG: DMT family transporter [Alphaproteobacteria bacterium]|nr:DMT family transporter [Alphaproteobacteria bacterium]
MTSNTLILYALWSGLAGALIPVMAALNGTLGRSIQSPLHASLIAVGLSFAAVGVTLMAFRPAMPNLAVLGSAPPLAYFGGLAMAFYALTATFLAPRFGVGNIVISVVVAQLAMAALIDQFGLFGAPVHPLDLKRVGGLVLLAAGAALVALK